MESMPVFGRADELGELARAWTHATRTNGPVIVTVTGPAGIGKSRLIMAAVERFAPTPAAVHLGAARLHSPAPYDWLAAVLSQPGCDDMRHAVPVDALAWLRQDVTVPRERYAPEALLRIAVRVVGALVGGGPAVLVVEDLHAMDPASLNLVAALATSALPVLLVVTSRPTDLPLVADTLARLAGTAGAIRQHLGPLDRGAVAETLTAAYGDGAGTATEPVWQRTGGNPTALTELLATTRDITTLHPEPVDLTAREIDVLALIAGGMSNQQVASRLGISVRTVTVHVSNLLRKTRSRSRTDAALWAVRHHVGDHSSATTTSS
jgi:two-component system, NarL family, nitrate/nitrite response regulator NarL